MNGGAVAIHQSRFVELGLKEAAEPDAYRSLNGRDNLVDLVLCRDSTGRTTAAFSGEIWDFTPYDEISKYKCHFERIFVSMAKPADSSHDDSVFRQQLIGELKFLSFLLIYKLNAGHLGQLSVGTFCAYFRQLRLATRVCYQQFLKNPLRDPLTLREMLGSAEWITKYLKSAAAPRGSGLECFVVVLSHLQYLGEEETGVHFSYRPDDFRPEYRQPKQHPVIPTRLYVSMVDLVAQRVGQLLPYGPNVEQFIRCFGDPAYGKDHFSQKVHGRNKGDWLPTFKEGAIDHGLEDPFSEFNVNDVSAFTGFLVNIQSLVKNAVHLYSGMRDKEARRLPIACIDQEEVTLDVVEDGEVVDKGRMIALLSTTTKYTGYRLNARWLAPDDVVSAVELGQFISRGLASLCNMDERDAPLFLTPFCVFSLKRREKPQVTEFKKYHTAFWFGGLTIREQDIEELKASDPERLWDNEEAYSVGKSWPLTSHQFRRSLAFYGASSGHVKLPNMRRQFQHLLRSTVTAYYARNHEKILPLFGFYNASTAKFELSKDHIIHEIRAGMPIKTAEALVHDLLGESESLFGKPDNYVDRLRKKIADNDVLILEVKKETQRRVKRGEMTYRETLVGGCMKIDPCEEYMLGSLKTGHCLGCSGATVKLSKVDALIQQTQNELSKFPSDSGEYQILSAELSTLTTYRDGKLAHREQRQ